MSQIDIVNSILLQSKSSSEMIDRIFKESRKHDSSQSLAKLAKFAGIASRGYLSEVCSGKKTLHTRYVNKLGGALSLSALQTKFLFKQILKERGGVVMNEAKLNAELAKLKKALMTSYTKLPDSFADNPKVLEIFCAFGLFGNRPSEEDLISYFGARHRSRIEDAIEKLQVAGLIREVDLHLELVENADYFFNQPGSAKKYIRILKNALKETQAKLPIWFERRDESLFDTTVISTTTRHYHEALNKFRGYLCEAKADMESQEADILIRLNVQVYPLHEPKK